MTDTQWPRYEVFKQDSPGKPHESVGSVHAPDAEMALLNARDVFARRPKAVSMWVARADTIFSLTAEEIAADPEWWQATDDGAAPKKTFHIFNKQSQRRAMTFVKHAGTVEAATAVSALHLAIRSGEFAGKEVFVWWVVPDSAITRSRPEDVDSHYAPAQEKTYRQQSAYGFVGPRRTSRKD